MKLTKEQLAKIIKEEIGQMAEAGRYGLGSQRPDSSFNELPDEPTTMSGAESANDLRTAIAQFVADNPQLSDPKATIMAIIDEALR